MSTFSKAILVAIFYAIYLLHNSKCNTLHRNKAENESSMEEFVRHIRTMENQEPEKIKICGARLPDMIRGVCRSSYYFPQGKRSTNPHEFERYRRASTKISKECCERGCDRKTLLKYCNQADIQPTTTPAPLPAQTTKTVIPFKILTAFLEFIAKSRSPLNGYESNFPVRTQTASTTEMSSPENFEERNSVPEAAALTDEQPYRGRHPIPKANIVRDDDDEGSVFSVGF